MAKVKCSVLNGKQIWTIKCPACGDTHQLNEQWSFNGDCDKPTFRASLLVRSGHYVQVQEHKSGCWCTFNKERIAKGEKPAPFRCCICHSFITDGKIEYLSDCTHGLAGQTVDLEEI